MTKNQLSRYVLTDELYKLLKDQIISHIMSAGDKINIDKLTRELGVSNIPIREALFRLASEGFVTNVPFKGMFVAEMNLKDIDDIFEIRNHLEELAIRKAALLIPRERLEQILLELGNHEQEGAVWNGEENRLLSMNEGLHGTILSYTSNSILQQMVTSLIERIYRYLNLYHYQIDLAAERIEHESIVQALLAGDTEQAVASMRVHLQEAHRRLRANVN
ncbi:GntR family transcriptional regulator [Paenibacillus monticola]|uniref:FCD domain-containing protein n=1 Tax=Paenibacillus monticola TaxID=2666075 RepID=A0A7X2H9Q1_9BACL|nr:GntR family transcriptional regulator [Paenibacillus monticola]MRN56011.1 FCD domain-containing protein [Paenibacillus monticola]